MAEREVTEAARTRPPSSQGQPRVREALLDLMERFLPHEADGLRASFALGVAQGETYTLRVADRRCSLSPGRPASEPVATITADTSTWLDLASGATDPVQAFMSGALQVTGDLNLALRLYTLFRPGPATTRMVRTAQTNIGGFRIESLVAGVGTPVVLIHGLGASKVSFLPTFDALADRFEVHALDLPGFGKSDRPFPTGKRYTMRWMAELVHGYLRRHRITPAYLVGNSMGGRIATEIALRYPRSVSGFVGLGAAVAFDEWQRFGPLLRRLQSQWLGLTPLPVRHDWIVSALHDMFHTPDAVPLINMEAAAVDVARDLRDRRFRMALLSCARHLGGERAGGRNGYWARLAELDVPSYWIWGDTDRLVSPRYADKIGQVVPGARVEVWERCGHVPQFEAPERTNRAIIDFIGALEAERLT